MTTLEHNAQYLEHLWHNFQRSKRQAITARYFRWWRRHVWLHRLDRLRTLQQVQRRDRVLRVAVLRYIRTRQQRGFESLRRQVATFRASSVALRSLVLRQNQRNAVHKWRCIVRHEKLEEQVVAQAWVLLHRRAVKKLLGMLFRWRKLRLCKGLSQWQLHVDACRWW
ncbi:hypothetical protein H257_05368 [Aphanomyces astaci]|uniref:Uncharacterized protein n=1 Tax=Aphanomyces astaci TaxID=112090 RepID=W4GPZ8_APHAT|nr:hypothetical protein H257_05368 [Aphanomyces astaci]ETV81782.1 hypothetical protein H257_05368 [Aphanomyces astaci]|eukprot:XP_009828519.1 hypothetical protein H257_05368 [Aphanomyces astaci]